MPHTAVKITVVWGVFIDTPHLVQGRGKYACTPVFTHGSRLDYSGLATTDAVHGTRSRGGAAMISTQVVKKMFWIIEEVQQNNLWAELDDEETVMLALICAKHELKGRVVDLETGKVIGDVNPDTPVVPLVESLTGLTMEVGR
jgi:hypothetical protein